VSTATRQHQPTPSGAAPIVFGSPERPLFGLLHGPEGVERAHLGVVLCNPLGYEWMCAHRTYRHMAERLAAAGMAALRFDYDGTGDSAGDLDDPGRVRAWLDSIHMAIGELRARTGVRSVALFGVRFAATLAALAASESKNVDALVLWAPSATGHSYVRELRAFRMIKDAPSASPDSTRDGEEIAGYAFDRETLAELGAVDLFSIRTRIADRILIVERDDLPGREGKLARHLEAAGPLVRVVAKPGYAQMMRDPQDTIVPFPTLDVMVKWLQDPQSDAGPVASSRPAFARLEAPATAPKSVRPEPATHALTTFARSSDVRVQEVAVHFGEGQRLFGIVTEPCERPVRADRPAILFLNVGANHHVGPNRMYVVLARRLAAQGYRCLRFDVGGLGDSLIAPGAPENRLYSKDSVGDVVSAMSFISAERAVDRFVLIGLCSGAYLAFHTAIEDPRVRGQILINPQTFEWKEGDSLELSTRKSFLSTRFYLRGLRDTQVWMRLAKGDINVRGITGVLLDRLRARASADAKAWAARLRGNAAPQSEVEQAFRGLGRRGTESLLVFSFNDGGLDMIEKHLGMGGRRMRRNGKFNLEIVEGADHTFTPIPSQRALYGLITSFVKARFP